MKIAAQPTSEIGLLAASIASHHRLYMT
jgi:hypothetical protein